MARVVAGTSRLRENHPVIRRRKVGRCRIVRTMLRAKKGDTAGDLAAPNKSHNL
jgi:hypothetical protein